MMLSAPPRALKLDVLDTVQVHGDVADVAEQRTRAPLAEMSMFSLTLAPLNSSVSMPSWPSTVSLPSPGFQTNVSLPAPSSGHVVAAAADDDVVAVAADQHVGALAADDRVVAGAAVDGELDDAGRQRRGVDGVVAAEAVDDQRVVGAFGAGRSSPAAGRPVTATDAAAAPTTLIVSLPAVPLTVTVSAWPSPRAAGRRREVDVDLRHVGAGQVVDRDGVGAAQGVERRCARRR